MALPTTPKAAVRLLAAAVAAVLVCTSPGCHAWIGASSPGGTTDAPPWNPPPRAAQSNAALPSQVSAAGRQGAPLAPQFAALADPRWIRNPDDRLNPLAEPMPASAAPSAGSALNERLRPHWHPAVPQPAVNQSAAQAAVQSVPPPDLSHRWRHPGLERLIALPADQRPDLDVELGRFDKVVATNAAIFLGHMRNPAAYMVLAQAIESDETNLWQRLAAIDAFADCPLPIAGPYPPDRTKTLQQLIDRYGRFSGDAARTYQADLHAELLNALARGEASSPAQQMETRFAAALDSPAPQVRQEALLGLATCYGTPLPAEIVHCVGDPSSAVRRAALHTLSVRRHPEALELVRQALLDQDLLVRLSAIQDLAPLGPDATAQLRQMALHGTDQFRATALTALVSLGDEQIAQAAASDKSWRVRRALVPLLDRQQRPRPVALAERLVGDISFEVAGPAIAAVARWPLADAGPILLSAMETRGYLTRKAAAQQLVALWPPAAEFESEAIATRRASQLDHLRERWAAEGRSSIPAADARDGVVPPTATTAISAANEQQVANIERCLAVFDRPATDAERADAERALLAVGPALPSVLQRIEQATGRPLPEELYRRVLPAIDSQYTQFERLTSADVHVRRAAADALAGDAAAARKTGSPQPLSDLALARLVELTIREPDSLVWASVFTTLSDDDREPAMRLAYAALGHPSPEVRRLACEYLAAHPSAQHGPVLSKSLADPNPAVVAAAVRAIGRLPSLDDPRPLENLLAAEDHALRVDAAESLARLGFPSGTAALERLAYDRSHDVRRQTAAAMGHVGDREFLPVLIHMLDDRSDVAAAALASLPRVAGRDAPAPQQSSTAIADTTPERMQRWKDWYAAQR